MSQNKNMSYAHPAYIARLCHAFPALAAGASGLTSKFVAFAALQIFGIQAATVAAGAGTSTATLYNGTNTVTAVNADTISLIRVMNNAAPGVAPSLSTATYGPFVVAPYNGTSTATQTGVAGATNYYSLYGTGTTGQLQAGAPVGSGGISVNSGDQLYIQRGTDASAITGVSLDFGITPLASVGA